MPVPIIISSFMGDALLCEANDDERNILGSAKTDIALNNLIWRPIKIQWKCAETRPRPIPHLRIDIVMFGAMNLPGQSFSQSANMLF